MADAKDEGPPKRRRLDVSERKRRNKECSLSVVKVGLASLGASAPMRAAIDDAARRTQRLVYEASLLANCVVVHALERRKPVPDIHKQTFWNRCISRCAAPKAGGVPKPFEQDNDALAIERAFCEVYGPARGDAPFETSDGIAMVLTDSAATMVTNAKTMVATTFHNRLRQALGRELDLLTHR